MGVSEGVVQGLPVAAAQPGLHPWLKGLQLSCLPHTLVTRELAAPPDTEPRLA